MGQSILPANPPLRPAHSLAQLQAPSLSNISHCGAAVGTSPRDTAQMLPPLPPMLRSGKALLSFVT